MACRPCKLPHLSYDILLCFLHLFLILIPHAVAKFETLSFNLININQQHQSSYINVSGKAYISDLGIQLVTNELGQDQKSQSGRATYKDLLHLWDRTSGNLASFTTIFSFVIGSTTRYSNPGDGLAFFLGPVDSHIKAGSAIGLPMEIKTNFSPYSPFLAVEFDTHYGGDWEPAGISGPHVGIDINSLKSSASKVWNSGMLGGGVENEAWISYNSSTKNLSVIFTDCDINNATVKKGLSFIVDMREHLPEWVAVGFTAATGDYSELHNIKSWQFRSSLKIENSNKSPLLVVGLIVGSSVLVGGFVLVGIVLWKKTRAKEEDEFAIDDLSMDDEFETGRGPRKFSYDELSRATNYFSEEEKLGEGGFGGVYRGFLRGLNSYVAVKRISKSLKQGIKEYASEVKIISRLRHKNLVQLIGWCHEKRELLLVYELMANGSLDFHLFKEKSLLTWPMRFKIAKGLASALLYLHEEWEQGVVHRDIKSSNVMLDSNFNAKLGDFGLARLVDHGKGLQTTTLAGTMGYMAPEYVITSKASKESDVYSFGVVALEIACGRKTIDPKVQESQMRMVNWVWDLYGMGNLLKAVDPKISPDFDQHEMECLMVIGLWCAHPDHNLRPSIRQVIQVLNFGAPLPSLPATMPVAKYFAPPVNTHSSLDSFTYGASTVPDSS